MESKDVRKNSRIIDGRAGEGSDCNRRNFFIFVTSMHFLMNNDELHENLLPTRSLNADCGN